MHAFTVWLCCEFSGLHKSIEKTNNLHVRERKSCTILWAYLKFLSCHEYKPISRPLGFPSPSGPTAGEAPCRGGLALRQDARPRHPIHNTRYTIKKPIGWSINEADSDARHADPDLRPPTSHVDVTWQRRKRKLMRRQRSFAAYVVTIRPSASFYGCSIKRSGAALKH